MELREARAGYLVEAEHRVPKGYKQTEVGVIPEDWCVAKFCDVTKVITCGLAATPTYVDEQNGKPFLSAQNVRNGKVVYDKHRFVSNELFAQITKHNKPQRGDILYTRVGAGIGEAGVIEDDYEFGIYVSLTLIKTDPKKARSRYIAHLLNSDRYRFLAKNGQFAGGGVQNLNVEVVRGFHVPVPLLPEQEAIAEALSDTDAFIESLEQMIAKKRQIKQAAMQELLTGKMRLPGFNGKWEVKRFGELAQPRKERIDPRRTGPCEFCIELEHIEQGTGCLVGYTVASEGSSLKSVFHEGDVLFGKLRAYLRKYWFANREGVCSTEIWVLLATRSLLTPQYLFQLVKVDRFIEAASSAYGTHMPRSDWNVVKNFEVALPTLPEQTAIAAILSDMDAEIAALEEKLTKTRSIKQGMMHNLLTGKIRLIDPAIVKVEQHALSDVESIPAAPKPDKSHNWAFNEAVVISVLADLFVGKPEFPLGRKRYTKLSYLMHRKSEQEVQGYLKKAAGPYNPKTKYSGPEKIAQENGYMRYHENGKYKGFIAGEKIEQAKTYFIKWYGSEIIAWLEQFRYRSNDDLELLATVDMAMQELLKQGKAADVDSVRALIASEPEWLPKLERSMFSDSGIAAAIAECHGFFTR